MLYAYTVPFGLKKLIYHNFLSQNSIMELEPFQMSIIPNLIIQYKKQFTDKLDNSEQWVNLLNCEGLLHKNGVVLLTKKKNDYTKNCYLNSCKMSYSSQWQQFNSISKVVIMVYIKFLSLDMWIRKVAISGTVP